MADTGSFDSDIGVARRSLNSMLENAERGENINPEIINGRINRYIKHHGENPKEKEDDYITKYVKRAKTWYKSTQ